MLTLNDVKTHLRVDHNDDDDIIQKYWSAAKHKTECILNRKLLSDELERIDETDMLSNDAIEAAVLLYVTELYDNRDSSALKSDGFLDRYYDLLRPYRLMGV